MNTKTNTIITNYQHNVISHLQHITYQYHTVHSIPNKAPTISTASVMNQSTPDQTHQCKDPSSMSMGFDIDNSSKSSSSLLFNQQRDEISSCPQHQTDDVSVSPSINHSSTLAPKQVTQNLPDSQDHHSIVMTHIQQRKTCNQSSYSSPNTTYNEVDDKVPVVHQLPTSTVDSSKKLKPKSDRCNLRKGKWMADEEEYTSMVIDHFRKGLLKLPEGATLRSFLAQKLNCDPMRITKKFAKASCLGKRVYHLCERPQIPDHEVEQAKAELLRLERKFRSCVDSGFTLSNPSSPILSAIEASSSIQPTLSGGMDPKIISTYLSLMNASNLQGNANTLLPFSLPSQYQSQKQSQQQFMSPNTQPWTQIQNTSNQAPNHAGNPFMNLQQGQDQQYQQMKILLNNANNNYHQASQSFINSVLSWMQTSQDQQTQHQLLKNILLLIQNGQHQQNQVANTSMLMKLLSGQKEQPQMNLLNNLLHSLQNSQDPQSHPCLNQTRQFMNQNGMWNLNNSTMESTNQTVSNASLSASQTPSQGPIPSHQCSQTPHQILLNNLLHSLQNNQEPQSQPCLNQTRQFMNQNGMWNMNNATMEPTNQTVSNASLSASQTPSQGPIQSHQCSQNQMPFALKQIDETSPRTLKDPYSTTKEISEEKVKAEENIVIPHSKEEEDAGRTLLGFLAELRKNHMEALNNLSTSSDESEPVASRDAVRPKEHVDSKYCVMKKPKSNISTNTMKSQTHDEKQELTSSLSLSLLQRLKAASTNQSSDDMMSSKALTSTSCSSATLPSDVSGGDTESNSDCRNSSNESDSIKCGSSDDEVDKICSKGPVRKRFKKTLVSE